MVPEHPKPQSDSIIRLALGTEELAASLALISRSDVAGRILASSYENITDEQANAYMRVASHSLLARGLCTISGKGTILTDNTLETLVFPLARFDWLLQASIMKKDYQSDVSIYVLENRYFTAHFRNGGGDVHLLEHGKREMLNFYVANLFGEFGSETQMPIIHQHISLADLSDLQDMAQTPERTVQSLTGQGWPADIARMLAEDMEKPTMRGTILKIDANSEVSPDDAVSAPKQIMFLLQGERNHWLFTFPATDNDAIGNAELVSRQAFFDALANYV